MARKYLFNLDWNKRTYYYTVTMNNIIGSSVRKNVFFGALDDPEQWCKRCQPAIYL